MIPTSTIEKRSFAPLLLLPAASLLLSLLYCPPVDLFFDDKEIFRYIGRIISRGYIPYRDVFDHKPPLVYFLNVMGPWGLWLIDTALVLLATLLFFQCCRRRRLSFPWLLPLLFNLLIRNYLVCMGIGMTRTYTAIFLLLFFCQLMGRSSYRYFWMGLLTAATLFMQQDQLLPLLPFFGYVLIGAFAGPWGRNFLQAAAGFATLTLPILFYFGFHHALVFLWADAFRFNIDWYTGRSPLSQHYRAIRAALQATGCLMPFIIAIILGIIALFQPQKNKPLVITALLSVALSFIADLLSGHAFYYYLLPLSASLPVLVFAVYTGTEESFLKDGKNQLLYGILICFLPLYNALQHATHLSVHNQDIVAKTPEFTWLRHRSPENYQLYIFGNSNWVYAYNQLNILSPSPWIYHYFWEWYPRWDAGHRQLLAIEYDLLDHKTRYVMDYSDDLHFQDPEAGSSWKNFLQRYYEPVLLPDTRRQLLWQLKSPQSTDPPESPPHSISATTARPAAGLPAK
jgi:hypothetical protein